MNYSEASYPFPGTTPYHFAHIAARDEAQRLARINAEARRLVNRKAR